MLTSRARKILFAVVAEYIATGEPAGSRTLSRKYTLDLSPATIRNVLADLEEAGYLSQPHTSAGRIPTDKAMRAFIEALTDFEELGQKQKKSLHDKLEEIYREDAGLAESLRETGQLLSELSGAAAIVATSPAASRKLAQLRFITTRPGQLLAVLVFSDGMVENRWVRVDGPIAENELERVHNLLADVVEGRTLAALRDLFARRLEGERVQLDELRRTAFDLGQRAVETLGRRQEVVIEGGARLMELPEYADVERLRKLVHALEDREHLVDLLDRTISSGTVSVYLGDETGELGEAHLSLVAAPYGGGEEGAGTIGVIGPTRMDYARVMPLVGATAEAISAIMRKPRG